LSIETEIKVRLDDAANFLQRLEQLRPQVLSERHFEDNFVLDYPDRQMGARQCLIRVRITGATALLTFKGPPRPTGLFKTREELETAVGNGHDLVAILRRMGMKVWFRYQKYRREFSILAQPDAADEIHVALDETPIGIFAEFEGSEAGIRNVAGKMGFRPSRYLRDSYTALFVQFCGERGLPIRHMTFRSIRASRAGKAR
jgi:predicted adenylyl cyclase CyaB